MTDGARIRGWRKFRGLKLRECAERAGVSRQTWGNWESDIWKPKPEHAPKIAKVLGVSAQDPAPIPAFPDPPRGRGAS
jgi:transcriptional regulator with XRE-family HTH domain